MLVRLFVPHSFYFWGAGAVLGGEDGGVDPD